MKTPDWARTYARRMFEQAERDKATGGQNRISSFGGGRWYGKRKAMQDEVDRAREAGQTVWVRKRVDGHAVIETRPDVLIDEVPTIDIKLKPGESREQADKRARVIHIARSVVESWPASSRVLGVVERPVEDAELRPNRPNGVYEFAPGESHGMV